MTVSQEKNKKNNAIEILQNLFLNLTLDPQLVYKIQDWVDANQEATEAGAEDLTYLALEPPRRTPDTEMAAISEIKLIQGFGEEEIEKLIPLITVLPKNTKINLNTALPEVIRSLSKKFSEGDARVIIEARGDKGLENIEALNKIPSLNGETGVFQSSPISFSSSYFGVLIKATYRDTTFYLKTLLYRNAEGQVLVVGREIGPSNYWVTTKKES